MGFFGILAVVVTIWIPQLFEEGPAPFHFAQDELGILVTPFVPLQEAASASQHIGATLFTVLQDELATGAGTGSSCFASGCARTRGTPPQTTPAGGAPFAALVHLGTASL